MGATSHLTGVYGRARREAGQFEVYHANIEESLSFISGRT